MRNATIIVFALAAGLTLSGIAANLYQLLTRKGRAPLLLHCAVMVFAGPSMLIESMTRAFRGKTCSRLGYALAVSAACYWCFALGLFVLGIGLAL